MNKTELINALHERMKDMSPITKGEAELAVGATLDIITDELAAGNKVSLIGFGTFEPTTHTARTGRNPRTGEAIEIPASKGVKFKAGKTLKEAVNG